MTGSFWGKQSPTNPTKFTQSSELGDVCCSRHFFCVGVDGWCKQSHFKPHVFFELFGIPYGSSSTKTSYRCLQIGESYQSISKKIPIIHIANTCSFCGTLKTENQSKLGCNIEHLYEIRSHGSWLTWRIIMFMFHG